MIPPRKFNPKVFSQPFNHLPQKIELTEKEQKLLNLLNKKKRWMTEEFLAMQILRNKEGESQADFDFLNKYLNQLQEACWKKGIDLPEDALTFF